MAYAPHRSAVLSRQEGMTDGSYKKVSMNRENAEPATARARRDLDKQVWHPGVNLEAPVKALPDATVSF